MCDELSPPLPTTHTRTHTPSLSQYQSLFMAQEGLGWEQTETLLAPPHTLSTTATHTHTPLLSPSALQPWGPQGGRPDRKTVSIPVQDVFPARDGNRDGRQRSPPSPSASARPVTLHGERRQSHGRRVPTATLPLAPAFISSMGLFNCLLEGGGSVCETCLILCVSVFWMPVILGS